MLRQRADSSYDNRSGCSTSPNTLKSQVLGLNGGVGP